MTSLGSMKLIFITTRNSGQTSRFYELVDSCIKLLEERVVAKFGSGVVAFEEQIKIGSEDEFCRIDCCVIVKAKWLWRIFAPLSQLLVGCMKEFAEDNSNVDLQFRTSLQINDRKFFDIEDLTDLNLQVKTQSVHFGNLIRHDSFLTHYIIDDDPKNGWFGNWKMMRYYFGNVGKEIADKDHTIYTEFENDRRRLTIVFPVLWPDNKLDDKENDPEKKQEKSECCCKLMISYASIRRILCDFETSDPSENTLNLCLHLKSPPLISIVKFIRRVGGKIVEQRQSELRTTPGDRTVHWIPHEKFRQIEEEVRAVADSPYIRINFPKENVKKCVHVLGRLFVASKKVVEIRQIEFYQQKKRVNYQISPLKNRPLRDVLIHNDEEDYSAIYLIEALLSRGAHVKDQLMVERIHYTKFVKLLIQVYEQNRELALSSLERLLNSADEQLDMRPLYEMFEESIRKSRAAAEVEGNDKLSEKDGYVRLRKVTITPTRIIFEAPELIMGNRVLRADIETFPPEKFLRVAFRDDDGSRIQKNIGKKFIKSFVKRHLYGGIIVADHYHIINGKRKTRVFNYLGSSNSQMREQGCYFIEANDNEIHGFRVLFGAFKTDSVPKLMARFGQCFTQSVIGKNQGFLELSRYNYAVEYTGGSDSQGKEYTFSDGVGCMSRNFAGEIAKELKLGDFIPSCIQSRFRGFKGVHALNPNMDKLSQWARSNEIDESKTPETKRVYFVDLLFRSSQLKFRTPEKNQYYEVVKLSGPSSVTLNRPMINILDQISAKQGYKCHQRVTNRIFQLLDSQLQGIARTMIDETLARSRLSEFPHVIMYEALQNVNLTQEPFFRAMLRIAGRCTLKKLRAKLQIAIPNDLGRSMLGVIDETGLLNYGQVYVRYTVNIKQKRPGPHAARKTLTGPVLITKNPMIVGGDIRMFEAIDIPSLNHLCDVIVFPRWGPRPHPDEMAGSDLDGDEYSVIWDPGMYLVQNEPAFDYSAAATEPIKVEEKNLREQMADFFIEYIINDSIGKLATAFLVNSDIYGIESEVCENVAKKNMEAVDFPKTGKPPAPLVPSDPANNMPSEDPPRKPDYFEQSYRPTYVSPRLNGRLFRRIEAIDDVLESKIDDEFNRPPTIDETFHIDGFEEYLDFAQNSFGTYKTLMENLLQRFGINSEVEIFSNSYSVMRKRISDKEEDDFSYFNTQRIIEEEIESIYSLYRKRLLQKVYGDDYKNHLECPNKSSIERESKLILRSVVRDPSNELKRLAVAYYKVAYCQGNQKFLSFAWVGADILFRVRQERINKINQESRANPQKMLSFNFDFDPLSARVSKHINEFIKARKNNFAAFERFVISEWKQHDEKETFGLIRAYCERHNGLLQLLYFCYQWAKNSGLLIDEPERTGPC